MASNLLDNFNRVLDDIEVFSNVIVEDESREFAREVLQTAQDVAREMQLEGQNYYAERLSTHALMAVERLAAMTDVDELTIPGWTLDLTISLLNVAEDDMAIRPGMGGRGFSAQEKRRFKALNERAARKVYAAQNQVLLTKQVEDLQASLDLTREEARVAIEQLGTTRERYENVLKAAENAAGDIATDQFEGNFVELEVKEARIANWFRWATIAGISLAVAYAVLWAAGLWRTPGAGIADAARWVEFASHLTIVAGVGALTAYLGRQAGQHRRTANWAQSIAVQVKSFPALASTASGTVKDALYVALANRVLAAPPEKGVEPDTTGVTSAQVMDIVVAAMKKTQTTTP